MFMELNIDDIREHSRELADGYAATKWMLKNR